MNFSEVDATDKWDAINLRWISQANEWGCMLWSQESGEFYSGSGKTITGAYSDATPDEENVSKEWEDERRDAIDDCYAKFVVSRKNQLYEEPEPSYENYDLTIYNMAKMIEWLKVRLREAHKRIDKLGGNYS